MATTTPVDGLTGLVDAVVDRQIAIRREQNELDRALARLIDLLEARNLISGHGLSMVLNEEGTS
jgi:hypothetical protein